MIVDVNAAATFPPKYGASQLNVAFAIFQLLPRTKIRKLRLKLPFFVTIRIETTNWTSKQIMI